jgi:hypothetical protein
MAATTTQAGSTRSRSVIAAAVAFACLVAGVVAIGPADVAGGAKAKEIGKTKKTPKASCPSPSGNDFPPKKGCQAFGEVTGFQAHGDGKSGLMKAPADGHIVGWAVELSRPNKGEQKFFEDVLGDRAFDGEPSARLSLLTRANNKKRYRLRAQSPAVKLGSLLGRPQYFTLNNPIEVRKGWISALTSQTWTPNFAHDLPGKADDNLWKASRTENRCNSFKDKTERSRPHLDPGSTRVYGCSYNRARVLYWAYFVAS